MHPFANVPIHPHTSPLWHLGLMLFREVFPISILVFTLTFIGLAVSPIESSAQIQDTTRIRQDSIQNLPYKPSRRPTFRLRDRYGDPFSHTGTESPLFLKDPTKVNMDVELDSGLNYTIYEKIGDLHYRPVSTMSFQEFNEYQNRQILKGYWQGKSRSMDGESPVSSRGLIPKIFISPILDKIFGGSYVELPPKILSSTGLI